MKTFGTALVLFSLAVIAVALQVKASPNPAISVPRNIAIPMPTGRFTYACAVDLAIPSVFANAVQLWFCARILRMSFGETFARGLPSVFPCRLARSNPAIVRSERRIRSCFACCILLTTVRQQPPDQAHRLVRLANP